MSHAQRFPCPQRRRVGRERETIHLRRHRPRYSSVILTRHVVQAGSLRPIGNRPPLFFESLDLRRTCILTLI